MLYFNINSFILLTLTCVINISAFVVQHYHYQSSIHLQQQCIIKRRNIVTNNNIIKLFSNQQSISEINIDNDKENNNNNSNNDIDSLGLTSELYKLTNAFNNIGDDKLRYKQLLFMANQLKPLDMNSQIPENKVRGCLSTVYIDATSSIDSETNDILIHYTGDSDGLLTKGLVAFLIRGLSGNTASNIQNVNPNFIKLAGIDASLTPGRNNGFLNMLLAMKNKAIEVEEKTKNELSSSSSSSSSTESESTKLENDNEVVDNKHGPVYNQIIKSLNLLKPTVIELKDISYKHSSHKAKMGIDGDESHFELYIVSDAFNELNLVKRHKLIYMILGDLMQNNIHALQIQAKTPSEIQS